MKRIEENAIKLCEINKALEAISKQEEATKKYIEVSETQLAGKCKELKNKFTSVFELLEAISKEEEATKTIQKSQKHNLQGSAKN